MTRPLRIEFNGAVYHITSRGNAKQEIFLDDNDNKKFLNILSSVIERFNWECHAYCLMNNHYHLIIETPDGNLSRGMRQLNGVYTQYFNKTHKTVGHLLQGRYKAIIVDKANYLLTLCRYIVLNPVKAGIAEKPSDWKWSSYKATAGISYVPGFLTIKWILSQFSEDEIEARKEYKKFVNVEMKEESLWENTKGQIFLGAESFIKTLEEKILEQKEDNEIPKKQRYVVRPKLEEIFNENKLSKKQRDKLIYEAYARFGYTLKEISEYCNVHYATISRILSKIENI